MTSHYRHRRLYDPAAAFPSPIEAGELVVNTANRQLAVGDASPGSPGAIISLLAVRYFDVRAQYAAGDFTVQAGNLYRAKVSIAPSAFDATKWDTYTTDAAEKAYVDAGDAAVTAAFEAADATLTTAVDGKIERAGDTMQGYLTLVGVPNQSLHAATKQYVDDTVAAGGLVTLPASSIVVTPHGGIQSTDAQAALAELDSEKAPLYSPGLLGTPTSQPPPANDNSNAIATTGWVQNYTVNYVVGYVATAFAAQASAAQPLMDGAVSVGTSTKFAREDHRHPMDTSRAPINSPAFTGSPTAPTPNVNNNSTALATTAFVAAKMGTFATLADPAFTGDPQAPTPAPGDNDTSIATTAFVAAALTAAVGAGAIAVPVEFILASKTVTIPAGAHALEVTLVGAGGGCLNNPSSAGGGATLFKLLTGLTPGNTLSLTIGAGGSNGGNGGATVLQSGTQAITALVAGGGYGDSDAVNSGNGGVASNGDLNITGNGGVTQTADPLARGGASLYGFGAIASSGRFQNPTGFGAGSVAYGVNGTAGLAILRWHP